jgi:mannose-1-phosphate guanylyltransferase
MCGGIGSRFWPYSRTNLPKQFLDFLGTGRSLLQMSYDRILPVVPKENIIILTNEQYADQVREQLPDIQDNQILLEPVRRNTAPCIAWAAWHIAALDPEASMIVTPSDHLITREIEFIDSIKRGFDFVESHNSLLTLGIEPTRPDTTYGYIQIESGEVSEHISKAKTFTEKPNIDLAKVFIETGEFFWNSGIFLWKAATIKEAYHQLSPDLAGVFDAAADVYATPAEKQYFDENFASCVSISVDFAIMEKARNVYVETVKFGWSNLGTWGALYEVSPKNRDGNVTQNCNVLSYNSSGNMFAVRDDKLVVVNGLKDYIISDAGDVLLICPKSDEQRIKQIVNDAKAKFGDKYI